MLMPWDQQWNVNSVLLVSGKDIKVIQETLGQELCALDINVGYFSKKVVCYLGVDLE